MPRGVKGSGAGRKPNAAKAAKTEKRAYKKRTPKTENKTEITVEINNPMNTLLEAVTELVKEALVALKDHNAKNGNDQPAAVASAPEAAPAAEPKEKKARKAKSAPAPTAEADNDPLAGLGGEETEAESAPEMTEEESKTKVMAAARAYLAKFGKEKGVPAVKKILKDNFKTDLLPNLTHEQRVKVIAILEDAVSA